MRKLPPLKAVLHALGSVYGYAGTGMRFGMFWIPLLFVLPRIFGETGIWMAAPVADTAMLGLIAVVLAVNAVRRGWRFGLLQPV